MECLSLGWEEKDIFMLSLPKILLSSFTQGISKNELVIISIVKHLVD